MQKIKKLASQPRLEYSLSTLASLGKIQVIINDFVHDNEIVCMGNEKRQPKSLSWPHFTSISRSITVWNLDTGELKGDLDMADVETIHVSPERYRLMKEELAEYDRDMALHGK